MLVYEEADGNGQWDAQEMLLPGRSIQLLDENGNLVAEYVTDGQNEPHCFGELAPGLYRVMKQTFTGGGHASMQAVVAGGKALTVEFGEQVPPTPVSEPTITPTPPPASIISELGASAYRISGILVLILALGIVVGYTLIQRQL